ncbi:MAG: hypothetical protein V2A74_08490 [bacterium]
MSKSAFFQRAREMRGRSFLFRHLPKILLAFAALLIVGCATTTTSDMARYERQDASWRSAMTGYLNSPEADAQNNAWTDYFQALAATDYRFYLDNRNKLDNNEEPLASQFLELTLPAIASVELGNKKPFARYPHWSKLGDNPFVVSVEPSMKMRALRNALNLKASKHESEGKLNEATATYENALTFWNRAADGNAILTHNMVCRACQRDAFGRIQGLMTRKSLTTAQLDRLVSFLESYQLDKSTVLKSLGAEKEFEQWVIENPDEAKKQIKKKDAVDADWKRSTRKAVARVAGRQEEILRQTDEIWQTAAEAWNNPSWSDFVKSDVDQRLLEDHDKFFYPLLPGISKIRFHEELTHADLRLTLLDAAIRRYHVQNGRWPDSLNQLALKTAPVDPFTGASFVYRLEDGKPVLYSLGPDMKDDNGKKQYDSDKGIKGKGDIVVEF